VSSDITIELTFLIYFGGSNYESDLLGNIPWLDLV